MNDTGKTSSLKTGALFELFAKGPALVVAFPARTFIDDSNVGAITGRLTTEISAVTNPKVVMDITEVHHISSAGLGMLINIGNLVKQRQGTMVVAGPRPAISEVFHITRLNRVFQVAPDRDAAVALLTGE